MTVQISGDTGVSKVQDGTIVQADLAANVAGNGPAFSAYQSSAQAIPAVTPTKLLFQTESFDTNNDFASSRFTASVSGYYYFTACAQVSVSTCSIGMYLRKGVSTNMGSTYQGAANTGFVSGLILLAVGEYVEVDVFFGVAQNCAATISQTNFQGFLARAA